jgi:hypothetical protein
LQNNSFKAEKILFNIEGSENLSMFQVEKISSHIANLNPKAKIIFGISKNSKLKNRIKTTILMTDGQIKEEVSRVSRAQKTESTKAITEVLPAQAGKIKKFPKKKIVITKKTKSAKGKKSDKKEKGSVSFIPVFEVPGPVGHPSVPVVEQNRMNITETASASNKKTIRRSGLEIKKAEELQEKKRIAQEKEWEIPAFLRKVKFKS